jgi:hypothetical protein
MKVEGALCFSRLAHDTIHLIKRQQAEIERLKEFEYMYNELCE